MIFVAADMCRMQWNNYFTVYVTLQRKQLSVAHNLRVLPITLQNKSGYHHAQLFYISKTS